MLYVEISKYLSLVTLLYFIDHFLNKNTYIFIYEKLREKAKNMNKFPNKWTPKPEKNLKKIYNK